MSPKVFNFIVSEDQASKRLDKYLEECLSQEGLSISRQQIQQSFEAVKVNGKTSKRSYKVKPGDQIEFNFEDRPREPSIKAEAIDLDIIYEDEHILVINKPAGMVVHPAKGNYNGTLVNALMHKYKDLPFTDQIRPGIVHRLDKDTSGLMLIARSLDIQINLQRQFKNRKIKKTYHCIIRGDIPEGQGEIDLPIKRHPKYRKKMAVLTDGKQAITRYKVIKRWNIHPIFNSNHNLVEIELITGRTHQIRVHLSYRGFPIVGDSIYSKTASLYADYGLCLCAKKIEFYHPAKYDKMEFEINYPNHLVKMMNVLENS